MNLQNLDFTPLWITMKTGVAATFVSFFLGIFAARFVMGRKGKARAFWDGFLTMPLVLPPTVAGYILLRTFSTRRPFGRFLANSLGIQAVHTWLGCVLAATVIAFPLMYRNARAAFEQVDENVIYAAQTLGLSERTIFWKIRIPMAKPGILSGTVLAFARAIGGDFHACRKYRRQDFDDLAADRHGAPERRFCTCRFLVSGDFCDFVCVSCCTESVWREEK